MDPFPADLTIWPGASTMRTWSETGPDPSRTAMANWSNAQTVPHSGHPTTTAAIADSLVPGTTESWSRNGMSPAAAPSAGPGRLSCRVCRPRPCTSSPHRDAPAHPSGLHMHDIHCRPHSPNHETGPGHTMDLLSVSMTPGGCPRHGPFWTVGSGSSSLAVLAVDAATPEPSDHAPTLRYPHSSASLFYWETSGSSCSSCSSPAAATSSGHPCPD